jgi:hypothetical protein
MVPVRVVFRIAGDDAADMHPAGGMYEIAVPKVDAHMTGPFSRVAEKEQVAAFKVFQAADINRFAIPCLLRCIPDQDDALCIEKQLGKSRTISGLCGCTPP